MTLKEQAQNIRVQNTLLSNSSKKESDYTTVQGNVGVTLTTHTFVSLPDMQFTRHDTITVRETERMKFLLTSFSVTTFFFAFPMPAVFQCNLHFIPLFSLCSSLSIV